MGVSSYFEFVTTLFGWVMYDQLWNVISGSGLVAIPFIVVLVSNISSSKRAGDDEGSAGIQSLKKTEIDIVLMIGVIFLAAVPFSTVNLSEMHYAKPAYDCSVADQIANGAPATVSGNATGTTYDATLQTLSGETGRIPVWWSAMHVLTKAVVAASIASIPCTGDLAAVNMQLENDSFTDPRVAKEVQEFIGDCYMPAKSQFIRQDKSVLTTEERDSINYLGSSYFANTPGYYDKFYSRKPRDDWAFDAVRDGGYEHHSPAGHPTCKEWWDDSSSGIRGKVLKAVDQDIIDEHVYNTNNLVQQSTRNNLNVVDREDVYLRKVLAIQNSRANISGYTNDVSVSYAPKRDFNGLQNIADTTGSMLLEGASTVAASIGMVVSAPSNLAGGVVIREGVSIFVSIILMMFVVVLPFLMLFSLYKLSTLLTLTLVFFSLHFFYFLWAVAFWVDNSLIAAIMSSPNGSGVFTAVTNPVQTSIIVWSQRILYVAFPMIWMSSLTWVGIRAANALSQSLSGMSEKMAASGEKTPPVPLPIKK